MIGASLLDMEHCQTLEFLICLVYNRIYRYRVNLPSSAVRDFFFSAVLVLNIWKTQVQYTHSFQSISYC